MDYNKIKEAAQNYEADMTRFLRELVHFPGESCGEKDHVMRIKEEMEKLGFDKVDIATKPELHVEICSACHPFYTGQQKAISARGRIDKFNKKYGIK